MAGKWTVLLKGAACAGILLLFFPLLRLLTDVSGLGDVWAFLGQGLVFVYAGAGYGIAAHCAGRVPLTRIGWIAVGGMTCAGATLWGLAFCGFVLRGGAALLAAGAVVSGALLFRRSYSAILTGTALKAGCGLFIVCTGILQMISKLTGRTPNWNGLCVVLALFLGLYTLVRNQSNLDWLMERRRHRLQDMPPKIRDYNLLLTGAVCVVTLALFFGRRWVTAGLRLLLKGVAFLISGVLWVMQWLGSLFASKDNLPMPFTQGAPEGMGLPNEGSGLFWIIMNVLFLGVVLWLIYVCRHQILAFMRERWAQLARWGKVFAEWLLQHPVARKVRQEENTLYTETAESIDPGKRERIPVRAFSRYTLKKGIKRLIRMPDSAEKYRFGYGLLLGWLRARHPEVHCWDTVREIAYKTAGEPPVEAYVCAAFVYEQVRYGVCTPSPKDLQALRHLLEEIVTEH